MVLLSASYPRLINPWAPKFGKKLLSPHGTSQPNEGITGVVKLEGILEWITTSTSPGINLSRQENISSVGWN